MKHLPLIVFASVLLGCVILGFVYEFPHKDYSIFTGTRPGAMCETTDSGTMQCSDLAARATVMAAKLTECNTVKEEFHNRFGDEDMVDVMHAYFHDDLFTLYSVSWLKTAWSNHSCDTTLNEPAIDNNIARLMVEAEIRAQCEKTSYARKNVDWDAIGHLIDRSIKKYSKDPQAMPDNEKQMFTGFMFDTLCKRLGE